jgi:hypothetical protein
LIFGAGDFPRSLGHVPKPSSEHDHLDKEYKGQNGALGRISKPEGFRCAALFRQPY